MSAFIAYFKLNIHQLICRPPVGFYSEWLRIDLNYLKGSVDLLLSLGRSFMQVDSISKLSQANAALVRRSGERQRDEAFQNVHNVTPSGLPLIIWPESFTKRNLPSSSIRSNAQHKSPTGLYSQLRQLREVQSAHAWPRKLRLLHVNCYKLLYSVFTG